MVRFFLFITALGLPTPNVSPRPQIDFFIKYMKYGTTGPEEIEAHFCTILWRMLAYVRNFVMFESRPIHCLQVADIAKEKTARSTHQR